jgi:DNA mismatch repair endonuclease MutH
LTPSVAHLSLSDVDPSFDHRSASEADILAKAAELEGRLLGDLPGARFTAATGAKGRAEVGLAVESYFGIPPNPSPLPDFPGAGIELKVVPLRRSGRGIGVKERTVIAQIDYVKLMDQTWATASVRNKLKILFVFFEHVDGIPKGGFPIRKVHLWQPDERVEELLQADWERVFTKVRQARAHELSESDGALMGPCTKAAKGTSVRRQPFSDRPAKPRAWALKPSFTLSLYRSITATRPAESLIAVLQVGASEFQQRLLDRFSRFEGRTVDEVADELTVPRSTAKSYAAAVARRIFGARSFRTRILEFDEMGLTPRVTRVAEDLMPYESTSFPAFRHGPLLDETWEDSDLLSRVEYMLFIPLLGRRKGTPQGACSFLRPVFWRPTAPQLDLIRREWEIYRLEIGQSKARQLTPASMTRAIHVRPHGRDSRDTDDAPGVGAVVKKSFWLNRPFVRDILRGVA